MSLLHVFDEEELICCRHMYVEYHVDAIIYGYIKINLTIQYLLVVSSLNV